MKSTKMWWVFLISLIVLFAATCITRTYATSKMKSFETQMILEQAKDSTNYSELETFKEAYKWVQKFMNILLMVEVLVAAFCGERIVKIRVENELQKLKEEKEE